MMEHAAGAHWAEAVRMSGGESAPRREAVAEEEPVALVFNGLPFAVMMATPVDLEDLAVGFSLTEQIVADPGEILAVRVGDDEGGVEVRITLARDSSIRLRERHRRGLLAGSSCGLCGSDSFEEALRPLDPVPSRQIFEGAAICRAMAELPTLQRLNRQVGGVHAAAFARSDGHVVAVREDIGRHNALDKLVGFLARNAVDPASGFVAVSSRCSFEMVHKTAAAGIPLIAAVSAPTSKGIELANASEVGLAAFAREGRFTLYANPWRVCGAR